MLHVYTDIHIDVRVRMSHIGVTGKILLHHFCYLLRAILGDDATKVMVPSETGNSIRRYVTLGIYGQP
jgi:hypothetical protein